MWQGVWGLIFEVQCGQKARGTSMVHQQGAKGQPENGNAVCLGKGQNRGTADAGWAEPPEALCSLDALPCGLHLPQHRLCHQMLSQQMDQGSVSQSTPITARHPVSPTKLFTIFRAMYLVMYGNSSSDEWCSVHTAKVSGSLSSHHILARDSISVSL